MAEMTAAGGKSTTFECDIILRITVPRGVTTTEHPRNFLLRYVEYERLLYENKKSHLYVHAWNEERFK